MYLLPPEKVVHRPDGGTASVGGDAHIAPWGMSPERSEKTDTPIPSGPRADEGIGPLYNRVSSGNVLK